MEKSHFIFTPYKMMYDSRIRPSGLFKIRN